MQTNFQTIIVGAGIVGVSAAWELAKLGRTDILVIDRAPLFETGGSTSHAPGGVFQNNASRTVSKLAQWTYRRLCRSFARRTPPPGSRPAVSKSPPPPNAGTISNARSATPAPGDSTPSCSIPPKPATSSPSSTPTSSSELIHVAGDGIVRAVPTVEQIAKRAEALGVTFLGETELLSVDMPNRVVRGIHTSNGDFTCDELVLCGGIWGPLLGELTDTPIPLHPCAHPYIRTTPLAELEHLRGQQIVQPLWRHQDHSMYLWQDGDRMGVGNYRHDPVIWSRPRPSTIPAATPPSCDFDPAPMDPGIDEAMRLVPGLRDTGITDRVYGMFSFTVDAQAVVGEVANATGLWTAMAIWVTHSTGTARALAQQMVHRDCELDMRELDVNRFASHHASPAYVHARGWSQYAEVYDIIHPKYQISKPRGLRRAPWYAQQVALGAHFFESNGWERPQWFEANANLAPPRSRNHPRRMGRHRVVAHRRERNTSPPARSAGIFDLSTFMRIELSGPNALAALERLSCSKLDRPAGRVTYSLLLDPHGGVESDVTIARLSDDRFMIMSGSSSGPRDLGWIENHLRDMPDVVVRDVTPAWAALGLFGPNALDILASDRRRTPLPRRPSRAIAPNGSRSDRFRSSPSACPTSAKKVSSCIPRPNSAPPSGIWSGTPANPTDSSPPAARPWTRFASKRASSRSEPTSAPNTPRTEAGLGFTIDKSRSDYIGADALARSKPAKKLDHPAARPHRPGPPRQRTHPRQRHRRRLRLQRQLRLYRRHNQSPSAISPSASPPPAPSSPSNTSPPLTPPPS